MFFKQSKKLIKALIILFSLAISSKSFAQDNQDFVIAKVNNKIITNSQVRSRLRYVQITANFKINNSAEQKILLEQIIDKMIDEELFLQEAEKLKIEISENEINQALETIALKRKQNIVQFKLFLSKNSVNLKQFSRFVEAQIAWEKIVESVFVNKIKVSDIEIEELLEQGGLRADKRKFLISEMVVLKNSKNSNSEEFVNKIYQELLGGANFKEMVRQFSVSLTAQNDGEIGWVGQGDVDSKIYQAINTLAKNSYSKPILLNDGYHIFKLLDAKVEKNIDEKQGSVAKNIITRNKLNNMAKGYLMDIRKKAFVEIL
ncbi:MAG: peptidylprolyl isomerase [Alphaproteobacteria bacterium]